MHVILGGGITGLYAANDMLRKGHEEFVLLDKGGILSSNNHLGFFYAHKKNPFCHDREILVVTSACANGSKEQYATKVYGNTKDADKLSYAKFVRQTDIVKEVGWQIDMERLTEKVRPKLIKESCYRVDPYNHLIYTTEGKVWSYDTLVSTAPLPQFLGLIHWEKMWKVLEGTALSTVRPSFVATLFKSKPIHMKVEHEPSAVGAEEGLVLVNYCASSCHPWYRKTIVGKRGDQYARFESMETMGGFTLRPGKIWYDHPDDQEAIQTIVRALGESGIWCLGRYAAWIPKYLTSHAWDKLENWDWKW